MNESVEVSSKFHSAMPRLESKPKSLISGEFVVEVLKRLTL
jgi:hypothetical protein